MDAPKILSDEAYEHHRRSRNKEGGSDTDNQESDAEEAAAFQSAIVLALDKVQGEEQEKEREQRRKHRKKGLVPGLHQSDKSGANRRS